MAQITTNNRAKLLAFIGLITLVVIVIIWALTYWLITPEEPQVTKPCECEQVEVEKPAELPKTGVDSARIVNQPNTGVEPVDPIAPTSTSPVEAPVTNESPVAAENWADEMTQAGIQPADQQIALALIRPNGDWLSTDHLAGRAITTQTDPADKFRVANSYVIHTYGEWRYAQAKASVGTW